VILHQAYRYALDPTGAQRSALAGHCGAARFAFNWGREQIGASMALARLEEVMGLSRTGPLGWSLYALRREWNSQKETRAPWWRENSKEAYSSGLDALARALENWSQSRRGERAGPRVGFPRFRKRGHPMGCRFTTGAIRVDERHVILPRIGRVRTCEATTALLRRVASGTARIQSATVSCEAGRWFVSFGCEVERAVAERNGHADTVGVDLGVLSLATLSTGEVVPGPRALRAGLRRLRRLSRHHARCGKGSANRRRAAQRLARHHARLAHLRRDHLHQLTTRLAKSHGRIVIEDLNVSGMTRSARGSAEASGRHVRAKAGLNRSLADSSFGELRRMLEYKCRWYGAELVVADRFYPSSKTCSRCGTVRSHLGLGERLFRCAGCGLTIDRDLNAAINLAGWAHPEVSPRPAGRVGHPKIVAGSAPETENACPRGCQPGLSPARPVDAGTGIAPEPAGSTGGCRHPDVPYVRC
jgi:putative transposase